MTQATMTPEEEISLAQRAEYAYTHFIEGFIESRLAELYRLFLETDYADVATMQEIRRLANTLNMLDREITAIIQSGKIAEKQLKLN